MTTTKTPTPALTIGLIVDSDFVSKYVYELAEWGVKQDNLAISHLIIQTRKQTSKGKIAKAINYLKANGLIALAEAALFSLIIRIEEVLIRQDSIVRKEKRKLDLTSIISRSISIEPQISKSGFVYRFSEDDIERIKSLNLDLIIRCGSGILRGEILNSSRLGIISIHHGDNRVNRGGPAGFWEVYLKQVTTGFTIQRLTEELDGGQVLMRGNFLTEAFFLLNRQLLYKRSNFYLMKILSEIASTGSLPFPEQSQPYFHKLFVRPTISEQFKYLTRQTLAKLHHDITYHVLRRRKRWDVAFSRGDWKDLVMWRSKTIKHPSNCYLADPFVIEVDKQNYCFLEEYSDNTRKGCISVYRLKDEIAEKIGIAIAEPFHLSFPYLFRYKEKVYLIPESLQSKDIRLYECERFPLQWRLSKILLKNISAVDSLLFEKDGLWWLFTNVDATSTGDHNSGLFIFYADNPLSTEWLPHRRNPVVLDASKARNGGLLTREGSIYRVAQNPIFKQYGKGFSINKIITLNVEEYIENEILPVEAKFFENLIGTHHLHCNGSFTVFDYLK